MKIWWPWRKNKPQLLSLFDPPFVSDPEAPQLRWCDWSQNSTPHPDNAPGPFYVADTECMACGYPHVLAPDLMAWTNDWHCYFKKQPQTSSELEQAVKAVAGSCCGQLRYTGVDAGVSEKIRQAETSRSTQNESTGRSSDEAL